MHASACWRCVHCAVFNYARSDLLGNIHYVKPKPVSLICQHINIEIKYLDNLIAFMNAVEFCCFTGRVDLDHNT